MQQYQTHTYQYGNVEIVVYRPVLDDRTRRKQEEVVKRTLASIGREMAKRQK